MVQIANVEWLALHADVGRDQRVQSLGGLRDRLRLLCRLSSHSHLAKLLGHALNAGLRCGLLGVSRLSRVIASRLAVRRLAICGLLLRRRVCVTGLSICWLLWHTIGGLLLCLLGWVSVCASCDCDRCIAWRNGGQASICARAKIERLTGVCSLLLATSCWCRSSLLLCTVLLLAVLLAVLVRVGHVEGWR